MCIRDRLNTVEASETGKQHCKHIIVIPSICTHHNGTMKLYIAGLMKVHVSLQVLSMLIEANSVVLSQKMVHLVGSMLATHRQ